MSGGISSGMSGDRSSSWRRFRYVAVFLVFGVVALVNDVDAGASTTTKPTPPPSSRGKKIEAEVTASGATKIISSDSPASETPPFVTASDPWLPESIAVSDVESWKEVKACCRRRRKAGGEEDEGDEDVFETAVIGRVPQMNREETLRVLDGAVDSWKNGSGTWPQMTTAERVKAVEEFVRTMQNDEELRRDVVQVLMWEVGKNHDDAVSELDRTIQFIRSVLDAVKNDPDIASSNEWSSHGSTRTLIRRAAVGIVLCLGPYNYPLNETYATLIPALLMGNVCILKVPTVGGLVHLLLLDAFRKSLPRGAVHYVSGAGRHTMPHIMKTGKIDALAFVGGSEAADKLIADHPHPHRLKVFLQLEAKNMAVYLPDLFQAEQRDLLQTAYKETVLGTLSFNGQRCTSLKILFVPESHASQFVREFTRRVEDLSVGLAWEKQEDGGKYSQITPLPNQKRVDYMKELIDDAVSKGAEIQNRDGGKVIGGPDSTLMVPAVLYPVTPDMKIYREEQFGPVIPIATYGDDDGEGDDDYESTVLSYGRDGAYGQQVSIFGTDADAISETVDVMSNVVGRINFNAQCGRSPDAVPFTGRRSSAMGTMSVRDSLKEFSVPVVAAYRNADRATESANENLVPSVQGKSNFFQPVTNSEQEEAE